MKLLITHPYSFQVPLIEDIRALGFDEITTLADERSQVAGAESFDVVVCNALFQYNNIADFTSLRMIQLTSAGLDRVPLEEIKQRNILLANAQGVYSIPIAEWVVLKILELYKQTRFFEENQRQLQWKKHRQVRELFGKTVGIVGCGSIGKEIAKRLQAFSAKIVTFDLFDPNCAFVNEYYHINQIHEQVSSCDILILTLPLTTETHHLGNAELFAQMTDGTVLINVSRGGLINENDLLVSLAQNKFSGVALDVFEEEPLAVGSPLWTHPNVLITPHNAFESDNIQARMYDVIYNNLRRYLVGQKLVNLVSFVI